jgi:hypothetical protein
VQFVAVASQNVTNPGDTAVPPAVTVAVKITIVCGGNGEPGELDGDTASVVVVAVCARIIVPGSTTATKRRTIHIRQRNPQEQKSFICILLAQVKFSCEVLVSLFGTSADPARKYSGERLESDSTTQAYERIPELMCPSQYLDQRFLYFSHAQRRISTPMRVLKSKGKTLNKFVPILDHVLRCTTENVSLCSR